MSLRHQLKTGPEQADRRTRCTNAPAKGSLLNKSFGHTGQHFISLTCCPTTALINGEIQTHLFSQGHSRNRSTEGVHQPQRTDTFSRPHICTPLPNLNLDFQLMARLKGIKLSKSWEEAIWQEP